MKKFRWILVVLVLAALACSLIPGGNGTADNTPPNSGGNTGGNNASGPSNDTANDTGAAGDNAAAGSDAGSGGDALHVSSDLTVDSVCYNAFLPVNRELTWTYQIDSTISESTLYTIQITDVTADSFTSTSTYPTFTGEVLWHCGAEGLYSSDLSQLDFVSLDLDTIEVGDVSFEGVILPNDALWTAGYSWNTHFEISANMTVEEISVATLTVIDMTNTIVAIEEITTPAGTFPEAYRVEQAGSFSMEIEGGAIPFPFSSTTWYVRDVGMVKTVSTGEFGGSSTVLVSIE